MGATSGAEGFSYPSGAPVYLLFSGVRVAQSLVLFRSFFVLLFSSFMVFSATFNNISVVWWSVLFVEETKIHGENHRKSLTNFIT
jgi:hypothetical protein